MPVSICIREMPVVVSPRITAHWIGAARGYLGRIEAWS
jgi:hypothetical protein